LVSSTGKLVTSTPYTIHREKPVTVTTYIRRDIDEASFSFQIFTSCGVKLVMEHSPAAVPTMSAISNGTSAGLQRFGQPPAAGERGGKGQAHGRWSRRAAVHQAGLQ